MRVFLAVIVLLLSGVVSADESQFPRLIGRVNDHAGVLTSEETGSLESMLASHEQATTNQIVILTMPTIGDTDIFSFSQAVYDSWKLGQKGKDNGVLIVMVKDRLNRGKSTRIHTGRGFEGALPDAVCTRIVVEQMKPLLLQGRYADGFRAGAASIIAGIGHEYVPTVKSMPDVGGILFAVLLFVVITMVCVLLWIVISRRREKKLQAERDARRAMDREPRFHASYPDRSPSVGYPHTSSRSVPRTRSPTRHQPEDSGSYAPIRTPDPDPPSFGWSSGSDSTPDFSGGGGESAGGGGGD